MKVKIISESAFTVEGHGPHTAFLENINVLKGIEGVEVLVNSLRGADVAHVHTVGPYSLFNLIYYKDRSVITAHLVPESIVGSFILSKMWLSLFRKYLRFCYNKAGTVIAISPEVERNLRSLGVKSRIAVLGNYVDRNHFKKDENLKHKLRNKYGISPDEFVVLGVGQVQPRKGVDSFCRVAEMLPDYRFVWVGGMPFSVATEGYARMNRLMQGAPSNILFTGIIPYQEVNGFYNMGDVFFLPSYHENFPFVALEAASCNLPLVLRDIQEYRGFLDRYSLRASDDRGFAELIKNLHHDRSLYAQYADRSEAFARKHDSRRMVGELMAIYTSLAEQKNAKAPAYKNWLSVRNLNFSGQRVWVGGLQMEVRNLYREVSELYHRAKQKRGQLKMRRKN